jgi:tetratricopeptide (TPR) repeat protein
MWFRDNIYDSKVNPINQMMRPQRCIVFTAALLILTGAHAVGARQVNTSIPPPPPAEVAPEPVFDPFHAEKSIGIGTFYMKKGNYDAAIDRFEEAAQYQPALARPWVLLGEAFEKKRDYVKAIEAYKKYLQILPHAADAAKVKQRIAALAQKANSKSGKVPAH